MPFTRPRHWLRWLIGTVVVLAALAAAGPFIYIHFFNAAPSALSLTPGATSSSASGGASSVLDGHHRGQRSGGRDLDGRRVRVVGYRVNEVLLGQNATAVGRTMSVPMATATRASGTPSSTAGSWTWPSTRPGPSP